MFIHGKLEFYLRHISQEKLKGELKCPTPFRLQRITSFRVGDLAFPSTNVCVQWVRKKKSGSPSSWVFGRFLKINYYYCSLERVLNWLTSFSKGAGTDYKATKHFPPAFPDSNVLIPNFFLKSPSHGHRMVISWCLKNCNYIYWYLPLFIKV